MSNGYWPETNQHNLGPCEIDGDDVSCMYDRTKWPYRADCPDEWMTLCGRKASAQQPYSLTDVDCAACHEEAIKQGYGAVDSRNGTVYRPPKVFWKAAS